MSESTIFTCEQCGATKQVPYAAHMPRSWLRVSTLHSSARGQDIDTGYSSLPPIDVCSWACLARLAARESAARPS